MTEDITSACAACGASIYKEHIESGIARYEDGKLMCKHCVEEYETSHDAAAGAGQHTEFAPIALDRPEHEPAADMSESRIHGLSGGTLGIAGAWDESRYKRPLDMQRSGATRCRTFHCKLSEAAIDFMTHQVNDWLDENENIVIRFATSTIGQFEGKHTEPNLILTVFY